MCSVSLGSETVVRENPGRAGVFSSGLFYPAYGLRILLINRGSSVRALVNTVMNSIKCGEFPH